MTIYLENNKSKLKSYSEWPDRGVLFELASKLSNDWRESKEELVDFKRLHTNATHYLDLCTVAVFSTSGAGPVSTSQDQKSLLKKSFFRSPVLVVSFLPLQTVSATGIMMLQHDHQCKSLSEDLAEELLRSR